MSILKRSSNITEKIVLRVLLDHKVSPVLTSVCTTGTSKLLWQCLRLEMSLQTPPISPQYINLRNQFVSLSNCGEMGLTLVLIFSERNGRMMESGTLMYHGWFIM